MTEQTIRYLNTGWKFKRSTDSDEDWQHVEELPSDVHSELIQSQKISHPFVDLNELDASWVGEETWQYRTTFVVPPDEPLQVDLVFEGLDTFATVELNGTTILSSDNMFHEHRVNINGLTEENHYNILDIFFESARQKGLELVKANPEHDFIVHQTEVSRGPVRKAQYHWGWDWGPILMTVGPWRPVRLETYHIRFEQVKVDYIIQGMETSAPMVEFTVTAQVDCPLVATLAAHVEIELLFEDETVVCLEDGLNTSEDGSVVYKSAQIKLKTPKLWWPKGYGRQSLYQLLVRMRDKNKIILAEHTQTIGFRKVELIQEPDAFGQSFYFRINNIDIFMGGSNWIPADSFLSQLEHEPQRYRDWITLLGEGNQNMIRVWGGGIYEHSAFYETCDELGILVWQDFMFACASYPTYPAFLSSITTEATQNIRRLRQHPSIILWCGNNEDYQLIERYNLHYDFSDQNPNSWLQTDFPARYIYEHLLPTLVSQETSTSALYHPSSPWGNGTSTTLKVDPAVGDIHQWNMWHGEAKPFQLLPEMGGRFVSEFGMEAYPHLETIHKFVTDEKERYPGSKTVDFHNKAVGYERRLMTYLSENYRLKMDLPGFIHLTQVLQADAVAAAYKSWRRQWGTKEKGRKCGGALVWQLNDCWPTVSWSVVDYYMVKKPAWYSIQRAMKPLAVGVQRKFFDCTTRPADELWRRDTGHVDPRKMVNEVEFDVWVASSELNRVENAWLGIRFVSVKTGMDVKRKIEIGGLVFEGNGTAEILVGSKFEWDEGVEREPFVIHASLWVDGVEVSSDVSWPDPVKYLDFEDRGLEVKYVGEDTVEVTAKRPVKGFVFSERQGVKVSGNGFDVIPWEKPISVKVEGIKAEKLAWTFIGQ
ncbi:hypothetical protein QBC43DRAFT_138796 [Cladorrhinum sp. PSN259]|nr:hypothetical protein QBC43DRAFT_138796 [Cladorrhinum sp. PSN259]